jgi:hypothetical protein
VPFNTPWETHDEVLKETTNSTAGANQGNWCEVGSKEVKEADSLCLHAAALIVNLEKEEENKHARMRMNRC